MTETIEVRYKPVFGGDTFYHKYIIYTDSDGTLYYARGGPEIPSMDDALPEIETVYGEYVEGTRDWNAPNDGIPPHPREIIATGDDLSSEWSTIIETMDRIESSEIPYNQSYWGELECDRG